jgi:hypothetical protein
MRQALVKGLASSRSSTTFTSVRRKEHESARRTSYDLCAKIASPCEIRAPLANLVTSNSIVSMDGAAPVNGHPPASAIGDESAKEVDH